MENKKIYRCLFDLLEDESFKDWIINKNEDSSWEEFAIESFTNAKLVENAKALLLGFYLLEEKISDSEIENQLLILKSQQTAFKRINYKNYKIYLTGLIIGLIFSIYYFNFSNRINGDLPKINFAPKGLIEQVNNSDSPKLITLSDGSSVLLQPKSSLSYSKDFDISKREVFLKGEAFFEVSKNPKKPFLVFSNEIITQVYGTSFRVIAFDELEDVKVIVKTGKVKVRNANEKNTGKLSEITLLPNQAARYIKIDKSFQKVPQIALNKNIETSLTSIEKLSFEFEDTPIKQVFSTIQEVYNLRIEYPSELLSECFVTTSLNDVPLPEKLKILCFSIGENSNYEILGDKIIITSDGCK